jgi:2,4-dienoyl-CoA reductase-like NADH-dependent reductase (Old Yellow Enzyme family)
MSILFEKTILGGLELSNRFVRSATWEGMATEKGMVKPQLIDTMIELAKGGIGLMISSHAYVSPEGQASFRQIGIYGDECIPGLKQMTAAVHDYGGKIVAQLAHAGNFAAEKYIEQPPLAVSNFEGLAQTARKEVTGQDIDRLVSAFADAARRAREAGFDGVQLHSAHGYLLSQFLSPYFNRRNDDYGGSIQQRARIHVRICRAIRDAVGPDYPLLVKLNCRDFADGGLDSEESIQAAGLMFEAGLDAVEMSGGLLTGGKLSPSRPGINRIEKEAYFEADARSFKKQYDYPLILVGGIRSFEVAERLVEEGIADYISMSRPLIREPDLIQRWKSGDRRKSTCLSDNLCFRPGIAGKGIYCLTEERERR